jgi:hypothetical protein
MRIPSILRSPKIKTQASSKKNASNKKNSEKRNFSTDVEKKQEKIFFNLKKRQKNILLRTVV